jgi:Protein of unknown function (DUF2628)
MIVYTVHEPSNPPADRIDRAAELKFVRDGFSLMAALLGPIWMIVHGLWLVLIVYLLVATAVGAAGVAGLGGGWALVLGAALNLIVGFEWSSLRRWTLERRGWRTVGTVTGRNTAECERRFFESWLPGEPFLDGDRFAARAQGLAAAAGALGGADLGERGLGERSVVERGARSAGWRPLGWRRNV